jgi:hypothetical protein
VVPFYRVRDRGGVWSREANGGRWWWIVMTLNALVSGVENRGNGRGEEKMGARWWLEDGQGGGVSANVVAVRRAGRKGMSGASLCGSCGGRNHLGRCKLFGPGVQADSKKKKKIKIITKLGCLGKQVERRELG